MMEWFRYGIFIILLFIVISVILKMFTTFLWNKRLKTFQDNHEVDVTTPPRYKTVLWTRVVSLLLVFVLTSIFLFGQPTNDNKPSNLAAKTFVSEDELLAFVSESQYYNQFYLRSDSALAPTDTFLVGENIESDNSDQGYLDTNVQVDGVMEADIIKTDGTFIFYAPNSYGNQTINAFEVTENKDLVLRDQIKFENHFVNDLFLTNEYLVAILYESYMYRPFFTTSRKQLVHVYDKNSLELVYEFESNLSFIEYRMIEDTLYIVGDYYITKDNPTPKFDIIKGDVETSYNLDVKKVFYYNEMSFPSMTVFISLDLETFTQKTMAFIGQVNQVYMNKDTIIVTQIIVKQFGWQLFERIFQEGITTRVMKFTIDDDSKNIAYRSYFDLKGLVQNQLWIDIKDQYLRIASTEPYLVDFNLTDSVTNNLNNLYILKDDLNSDLMVVVGHLNNGLGKKNETIKSVSFNKDEVKIVTFYQTDPLYTIDLSTPSNPRIVNVIEEPGFSSYLHLWDDDGHMIGLGFQADNNGRVTGLKISAYQTNDSEEPLYTVELDRKYGYSEQFYNHRALLVSNAKANTPYQFIGFSVNGTNQFLIYMIDFTKEQIISEAIKIDHNTTYGNVDRGVYIGGMIYTFSKDKAVTYSFEQNEVTQSIDLD